MDEVDFVCGTSAGGILALLLASGYTPSACNDIYKFAAPHIFGHNPWRVSAKHVFSLILSNNITI